MIKECWIDIQTLIGGGLMVWYYEDDEIKHMVI